MDVYDLSTHADLDALAVDLAGRLAAGQVGILPTETVYGLMCRADSDAARARLYAIKGRDEGKPLQNLLADLSALAALDVPVTPGLRALSAAFWPGALTVVAPNAAGEGIGIRIPDHAFVLAVLRAFGGPIAATSANPAGGDPAASVAVDFADLAQPPDFVVRGPCASGPASTVVRLNGSVAEVLRAGALDPARIHEELAKTGMAKP